jgi:PAS domain-containing protein
MATRFTDDISHNIEQSDFVIRRWKWGSFQLLALFAITFVAIYLTASIMYDLGDRAFFFSILTFVFGVLCWFNIVIATRHRDLVMATEFQNTLLASSAQLGTRFCFITKRSGAIVYIDPGFQKLFQPFMHSGNASIDGFLTYAEVGEEVRARILDILAQNKNDRQQLTLKTPEGIQLPMMVSIDILARPNGYFLFRGRDFIEKRNTAVPDNMVVEKSATDTTSALLLSHALYALPEGILVADKTGKITYINHTLEEWLGYGTGEMLMMPLTLEEICHRYAGREVGSAPFEDFEGDVTLKRKDHTLVFFQIHQTVVRQSGDILGMSAIVSLPETAAKK